MPATKSLCNRNEPISRSLCASIYYMPKCCHLFTANRKFDSKKGVYFEIEKQFILINYTLSVSPTQWNVWMCRFT